MDEEAFDDYDRELELALFREYRDVVAQFQYVVETEPVSYTHLTLPTIYSV